MLFYKIIVDIYMGMYSTWWFKAVIQSHVLYICSIAHPPLYTGINRGSQRSLHRTITQGFLHSGAGVHYEGGLSALARALWYAIGQECVNRGNKQEREYAVGSLRSLMLS